MNQIPVFDNPKDLFGHLSELDSMPVLGLNREFDGQAHTCKGEHGKVAVAVRVRDIADCLFAALVDSSSCHLPEADAVAIRKAVREQTLTGDDLYRLPLENIDPVALAQCLCHRVYGLSETGMWSEE